MENSTYEQTKREQAEIAAAMRALPKLSPPQDLTLRLRVTASREAKRRRIHETWDTWVNYHRERSRVWFNNAMRPFALPAVGGVMSTLLMCGLMAAQYPLPMSARQINDVPMDGYVEAEFLNMGPISLDTEEVVVGVTVDRAGRVMDCELADDGIPIQNRDQIERSVERALLYANFAPARRFGERVSGGKVRLAFRHGSIDVQG